METISPFFRTRFGFGIPCTISLVHRGAQHKLESLAGRRNVVAFEGGLGAGVGRSSFRRPLRDPMVAGPFDRQSPSTSAGSAKPAVRCAASSPVPRRSSEQSSVSNAWQILRNTASGDSFRHPHLHHPTVDRSVILQHRAGLPFVGFQPFADHRFAIVFPDYQRLSVQSHRLSSRGGRDAMLYRVPQRGHCRRPVKRAIITL